MQRWRIILFWRLGFNPVSFWIASAYSLPDAQQWAQDNLHFAPNKKRGFYFKQLGSKVRYSADDTYYDYHPHDDSDDEPTQVPLALPVGTVTSVWRKAPKEKRRL